MNNFKVEYLENMKFVDWDNYEKSEMKEDCIKYIKDLQQRIDKSIKILEECKILFPHEFSWEEQADNVLKILKGDSNG